jgi:hypothetical protein
MEVRSQLPSTLPSLNALSVRSITLAARRGKGSHRGILLRKDDLVVVVGASVTLGYLNSLFLQGSFNTPSSAADGLI